MHAKRSRTHIKESVAHVGAWWIMETLKIAQHALKHIEVQYACLKAMKSVILKQFIITNLVERFHVLGSSVTLCFQFLALRDVL